MRLDKTAPPEEGEYHLERVFDHALTPGWQDDEASRGEPGSEAPERQAAEAAAS